MAEIKANSIDAIVTDAPYGLEFMGRDWDKGVPGIPYWKEAYRVLKPGGSMLVMGGTRTFHRLMVAIEDTGFIIKDTLMYLYGSGFPKAQDLGKLIDKRMGVEREVVGKYQLPDVADGIRKKEWDCTNTTKPGVFGSSGQVNLTTPSTPLAKHWDGWKVGTIKPAYEPIVWAVKPPEGSYTDNILKWGVGGVNIDECRIRTDDDLSGRTCGGMFKQVNPDGSLKKAIGSGSKGRFPANVILDEEAGRLLDEQSKGQRAEKPRGGKTIHTTFKNAIFTLLLKMQYLI